MADNDLPVVGYLYTHPCVDDWLTTKGGAPLLPDTKKFPLVRADAAAAAIAQRDARIAGLEAALRQIATWECGRDDKGSLGPREPFSWESVARITLDLAHHALDGAALAAAPAAAPESQVTGPMLSDACKAAGVEAQFADNWNGMAEFGRLMFCAGMAAPAAAPRQPLTDEQIADMNRAAQDQSIRGISPALHLARAVEAHYGIGAPAPATGEQR